MLQPPGLLVALISLDAAKQTGWAWGLMLALGACAPTSDEAALGKTLGARPPAGILYLISDRGKRPIRETIQIDPYYEANHPSRHALQSLARHWQILLPGQKNEQTPTDPIEMKAWGDFWQERYPELQSREVPVRGFPLYQVAGPTAADGSDVAALAEQAREQLFNEVTELCAEGFGSVHLYLAGENAGAAVALQAAGSLNALIDKNLSSCKLESVTALLITDAQKPTYRRADFSEKYPKGLDVVHVGRHQAEKLPIFQGGKHFLVWSEMGNGEAASSSLATQSPAMARLKSLWLKRASPLDARLRDEHSGETRNLLSPADYVDREPSAWCDERLTPRLLVRLRHSQMLLQKMFSHRIGSNLQQGDLSGWETKNFFFDGPLLRPLKGYLSAEYPKLCELFQQASESGQETRPSLTIPHANPVVRPMLPIPIAYLLVNRLRTHHSFRIGQVHKLRLFFSPLPLETGKRPWLARTSFATLLGASENRDKPMMKLPIPAQASPAEADSAIQQRSPLSFDTPVPTRLGMLQYLILHIVVVAQSDVQSAKAVWDDVIATVVQRRFNPDLIACGTDAEPMTIEQYFDQYFLQGKLSTGQPADLWNHPAMWNPATRGGFLYNSKLPEHDRAVRDYLKAHPDTVERWWASEGCQESARKNVPEHLRIPNFDATYGCPQAASETPPEPAL